MIISFGCSDHWSHENWKIELDLEAFCSLEGVKVYDSQTNEKVTAYPMTKVRKMFSLMIKNIEPNQLDTIHEFILRRLKKYADVFQQIRQKGR